MVMLSAHTQTEKQIHGWETMFFPRYARRNFQGFQHRWD